MKIKCFLLWFLVGFFGLFGFCVCFGILPISALSRTEAESVSVAHWGMLSPLGNIQSFTGRKSKGQMLISSENCFLNREGGGQVY